MCLPGRAVSGASSSDVWALGFTFGSPAIPVLYHWTGSAWAEQAFPAPANAGISGIDAVAAGNLWVSGSLTNNGISRTLMMHLDGTTWNIGLPVPDPGQPDRVGRQGARGQPQLLHRPVVLRGPDARPAGLAGPGRAWPG